LHTLVSIIILSFLHRTTVKGRGGWSHAILLLLSDEIAYPYSQIESRARIICQDTADPSEEEGGGGGGGVVVGGGVVGGEAGGAGVSCR
jgi:hypothetical protein